MSNDGTLVDIRASLTSSSADDTDVRRLVFHLRKSALICGPIFELFVTL